MKKLFIALIVFLAVMLLAGVAFMWDTKLKIESGDMVKWEGRWYTKQQIEEKFGPQYYNVPAKNTPEEVYTAFREALLASDTEKALLQMRPERREEYKKKFSNSSVLEKYKQIPDYNMIKKIEQESFGNFNSYYYIENNITYSVDFTKNIDGYWQIDII